MVITAIETRALHKKPLQRTLGAHRVQRMAYILTDQLHAEDEPTAAGAFARYRAYLASVRGRMPPSALALAESDWYFNARDHRAPHDAWLETVTVVERGAGERRQDRAVALTIRLLGAYHDGYIELHYRDVTRYRIELAPSETVGGGHRDWRYDELRLGPRGGVVHEIEWWGLEATGTWLIEAGDVEYRWLPVEGRTPVSSAPDA